MIIYHYSVKFGKAAFEDLLGKVLIGIRGMERDSPVIEFVTACGKTYHMYHGQDCCEHVRVADVTGEPYRLLGEPLTLVEESSAEASDEDAPDGSGTWTFYKLATVKGYVDIRWLGESNGYYSERVDFAEILNGRQ